MTANATYTGNAASYTAGIYRFTRTDRTKEVPNILAQSLKKTGLFTVERIDRPQADEGGTRETKSVKQPDNEGLTPDKPTENADKPADKPAESENKPADKPAAKSTEKPAKVDEKA